MYMKKLQSLSIVSLFFLICSGVYGIIIGIHYTNEYFSLTEELRKETGVAITTGMLMFEYFSGAFRGIITIVCGLVGWINIQKRDIKTGYFVFLVIVTLLYVLGLKEFPDTEELIQMLVAVFCLMSLSIYKFTNRKGNIVASIS